MAVRTLEAGAEPQETLESCHRLLGQGRQAVAMGYEIVDPDTIGALTR